MDFDWKVFLEDNENNMGQKKNPFHGRQELNVIVRKIAAGFGRHGDQWVNLFTPLSPVMLCTFIFIPWKSLFVFYNHNCVQER